MATFMRYFARSLFYRNNYLCRDAVRRLVPVSYIHNSRILCDKIGQEIKMPSLSPTMTDGTIVRWLKQEGDTISPGDVLCEIQTDKAIVGFEVDEEGILAKILVRDDSKDVKIGTVIGIMVEVGEDWKSVEIPVPQHSAPIASSGSIQGSEIKMPSLSPTMTEGTIVKWYKKEGEKFVPGDVLCDIQTDKAVVAFEIEEEGVLAKILVPEDTKNVKLGTVIAIMVNEGEDWTNVIIPVATKPVVEKVSRAASQHSKAEVSAPEIADIPRLCGPSVRHLLEEYGIKYSLLTPTGPHKVLLKSDVLKYINLKSLKPRLPHSEDTISAAPDITFMEKQNYVDISHTSMRRTIAKRLTESKTTIPHSYMSLDCITDEIVKLRSEMKKDNMLVSVNDFVIKCVAEVLTKLPSVNVIQLNNETKVMESIDISVAVATDKGLITPIVKQANILSVLEISERVKELAARARKGQLKPDEFQGGSFSISNLGMFGITAFSAVINPPQGAILAIGTSHLVFNEKNTPVTKMAVTLSFDARIISETDAAKFLQYFRELIENPLIMKISHFKEGVV